MHLYSVGFDEQTATVNLLERKQDGGSPVYRNDVGGQRREIVHEVDLYAVDKYSLVPALPIHALAMVMNKNSVQACKGIRIVISLRSTSNELIFV